MTNADRIRSMPDEELADFLDNIQKFNINCEPLIVDDCKDCVICTCYICWLDWLKQEVDNERTD